MTTASTAVVERMDSVRQELTQMESQFLAALPDHIPVARFTRVVMTAIQNNPALLKCDRRSLWNACMKAAQDGLLPDGRDGAIVPYGDTEDGKASADIAQWMIMIGGLRKKVRNSGEVRDWYVEVVYAGDHFDYRKGDNPRLDHVPVPPAQRTQRMPHQGIIAAYSIAVFKDGTKSAPEVMWIEDVEKVRAKSKAKRGPWSDATFYPEMVRKTVARRHAKSLPMSTDLDDLIRRDDDLYDISPSLAPPPARRKSSTLAQAFDQLASPPTVPEQAPPPPPPAAAPPSSRRTTAPPPGAPAPAPDQPGFVEFVRDRVARAGTIEQLDSIHGAFIEPVAAQIFPPDRTTIEEMFTERERELQP